MKSAIIAFVLSLVFSGMSLGQTQKQEGTPMKYKNLSDVSIEVWQQLARKKIFFGHQSVGHDILSGVEMLMKTHPEIGIKVIASRDPKDYSEAALYHGPIGENKVAGTKIDDFKSLMLGELGNKVNVALFKFCYIDILHHHKVNEIFADYQQALGILQKKRPDVIIIPATVPLRTVQTGPRALIKKLLGRPIGGYEDNISRSKFNALVRKTYGPSGRIMDLALWESTSPDGDRETFSYKGEKYEALYPPYTYDGGHLSDEGKKEIASQFLMFLASIIQEK